MDYDGITDSDLEERSDDLYGQLMAGFDSLPKATWTAEYRQATRELQVKAVEFRAIVTELSRRLSERTNRFADLAKWVQADISDATPGKASDD